jgi:hypothetical protein
MSEKKRLSFYIDNFTRRFLAESADEEVLKLEIKDKVEKALEALDQDKATTDNVMSTINATLVDIAKQHPDISMSQLKVLFKDMALAGDIDSIDPSDPELDSDTVDDDDKVLASMKDKLTDEDYRKLRKALMETKSRIRKAVKENATGTSELPEDVKAEIKKIVTDIMNTNDYETANQAYPLITQRLQAAKLLSDTNKRYIADMVDEVLKDLGYEDSVEDAGKVEDNVGEIDAKDVPKTKAPTADDPEKKLTESLTKYNRMMKSVYHKSSARFLE